MITRSLAPKLPVPSTSCLSLLRTNILKPTPSISRNTPSLTRHHSSYPARPIPPPTPFVPDVPTFLRLIGRQLSQHASKFTTWDQLFSASSQQLRNLGIEPPRSRRYLLMWRARFRRGEYGIGGDMTHVQDGVAEVRVLEREGRRFVAVNTPLCRTLENNEAEGEGEGAKATPTKTKVVVDEEETKEGAPVKGVKVKEPGVVFGPYFEPLKGTHGRVARIKAQEGLWEIKRGRKILGGERRRKYNLMVLRKKAKEAAK